MAGRPARSECLCQNLRRILGKGDEPAQQVQEFRIVVEDVVRLAFRSIHYLGAPCENVGPDRVQDVFEFVTARVFIRIEKVCPREVSFIWTTGALSFFPSVCRCCG